VEVAHDIGEKVSQTAHDVGHWVKSKVSSDTREPPVDPLDPNQPMTEEKTAVEHSKDHLEAMK